MDIEIGRAQPRASGISIAMNNNKPFSTYVIRLGNARKVLLRALKLEDKYRDIKRALQLAAGVSLDETRWASSRRRCWMSNPNCNQVVECIYKWS